MPSRWKQAMLFGIAVASGVALLLVMTLSMSNLDDFDRPDVPQREISFSQGGHVLQGTLYDASKSGPIVLLVHGDGAQDRTSDGGYLPMINALTDVGISVFSWDKPGVAASSGNWLDQSMQDRAAETVAALHALRALPGAGARPLGLVGFSQAGWVLPRVPSLTEEASFLVFVGAAVSWQEQGAYYATRRLEREGLSAGEIAMLVQAQKARNLISFAPTTSHADYLALERKAGVADRDLMSKARFGFVQRSFDEDVRGPLPGLALPGLVLSGEGDLNVAARQTVSVYRAALAETNPHNRFELVPGASHSLFVSRHYNYQLPTQWPVSTQARFLLSGRKAYAPQVLDTLADWIATVSLSPAGP